MQRHWTTMLAIAALLGWTAVGCADATGPERDQSEISLERKGSSACRTMAVPCCDSQTGDYAGLAQCTPQGLTCPQGTTRGQCSAPGLERASSTETDRSLQRHNPSNSSHI
jgi:hypothetical protein